MQIQQLQFKLESTLIQNNRQKYIYIEKDENVRRYAVRGELLEILSKLRYSVIDQNYGVI